jgi:hypothetical protein
MLSQWHMVAPLYRCKSLHHGNHPQAEVGVSNAVTINSDVANKPLSGHQWYQKGPSDKRIAAGNPDFSDMLWGRTWPTMTRTEGNKVSEGQLTKNNNQPLM